MGRRVGQGKVILDRLLYLGVKIGSETGGPTILNRDGGGGSRYLLSTKMCRIRTFVHNVFFSSF